MYLPSIENFLSSFPLIIPYEISELAVFGLSLSRACIPRKMVSPVNIVIRINLPVHKESKKRNIYIARKI